MELNFTFFLNNEIVSIFSLYGITLSTQCKPFALLTMGMPPERNQKLG